KAAIIQQEGLACDSVCTNHVLVAINRQQHPPSPALGRRNRYDPLSTELLSKKSLFYGARRSYCKGAGQRMRSFREIGIDGGYVQDCRERSVDTEHRRAGAAYVHVARSKVLTSVDSDRLLFDDARADAIR